MAKAKLCNQIHFIGNGEFFNGSFRLGALTLRPEDGGSWRIYVTASNEPDFSYASEAFASPKMAIAALDSLFHPWLHNSLTLIATALVIFFAYRVGWTSGSRDGIQIGHETEFNSLCGFSMEESAAWLQRNIPDNDRVPAYVQRYCLEELREQQVLSNEAREK